ncbi:30S ribosomal protein S12 methylthiotransferase RimO [Armatimonas rosea]|uniref:30S ribosomal protein S12 methylthiotransferase RimO n=1 Tax=Armatimonas rosea TaxID=685828 RepID=UPI0031B5CA7C
MEKVRIGLVSLGCPKNLVDSEELLGALTENGRGQLVDGDAAADVVVVNTCAFIESAKKESLAAIREALGRKERGEISKVVVAGCLAQRYSSTLAQEFPNADALLGIQSASQIADVVFKERGARLLPMLDTNNLVQPLTEKYPLIPPSRVRATAPWTAYLKISEGCDHACTFCSIPSFRGKHRSKPLERIVTEAKRLVDSGAVELNLIAQDTTAYGMDLYKELALPRLLTELGKIEGLKWVRLLYCYPTMMTDRLIQTMADTPNVAHYVDIPLQHGDDQMLKRMKRGGSVSSYYRLLERLRGAMPDIAVRTTFLVGFPGEDASAFENLSRFVREARFDRLGVFEYSPEEGTPGFELRPRVPERIARQRRRALMALQQPLSLAANQALVGRELAVLVEGIDGDVRIARSWRDAPEIDGTVRVVGTSAQPGDWVRVRITQAEPYDLFAEVSGG